MKKLLWVFACLITVQAAAWGVTGHRAVGMIADSYLNAKAKKRIAAILGQESIAMASNWMDEVLSDSLYRYTTDWHWTTIPDGGKYEDVEKNPDGKIIVMIEKFSRELGTGKLDAKQELEYLKMLIHLVGDIHQPLHVGKPGDRGGNEVRAKWFRNDTNLHRVWDSEMINETRLSYTELAQALFRPDKATADLWQSANPRAWALESMSFRAQVYNIGDGNLGYSYSYKNLPIVKQRIMQAGVRLGGLLNQIYGK